MLCLGQDLTFEVTGNTLKVRLRGIGDISVYKPVKATQHMQQVHRNDREGFDRVFERCTDNILRQVEELRDIASDFSIYSRIPRAELVPGDLGDALARVVEAYRDSARADSVAIHFTARPVPVVRFDRKLLSRAVRNLVENALRASPRDGEVEVDLEPKRAGTVTIRVRDSGPGVDPQNLGRIFDPYVTTHESGTGLGLAITRRIVEEHGGRIEARNRSRGGLEVIIELLSERGTAGGADGGATTGEERGKTR